MLFSCKPGDTIFIADKVTHNVTRDKALKVVRELELMEDRSIQETESIIAKSMGKAGWIFVDGTAALKHRLVATTDGDRAFDLAGEF